MKDNYKAIRGLGVYFTLFILFLVLYLRYTNTMSPDLNDMPQHAKLAIQSYNGDIPISGTPILYFLMLAFSAFSTDLSSVVLSLCFLLAFATSFRYYLIQKNIFALNIFSDNENKNFWLSTIVALSLIFVFVIPIPSIFINGSFYLGNFTPNIWHNSTTIFLFPFAILLYLKSCKQFNDYSPKRDIIIFILILLNLFIKPSFSFTFFCAYPLIMFTQYGFNKIFRRSMIPLIGGLFVLCLITWIIYSPENGDGSGIRFCLLCVYKIRNSLLELPFSIFFSLLFPILYIIFNRKKLKNNLVYLYTLALLVFSFLIYFFVAERGTRYTDGNFYWQIVICTWLFYFFTFSSLLKDVKTEGFTTKNKFLSYIYILHVIMGLVYVTRFLAIKIAL